MKRTISFTAVWAGIALASCSSLQTVSFDRLEAADVNFPAEVKNVAVVNNMPVVEQRQENKEISLQLAGDGKVAAEALAGGIADADYFDKVVVCDSALRQKDAEPQANVALGKEEVRQLAAALGVDLIFSFDQIHIETRPGVVFFPDYPLPVDAVEGVVTPVVRVYVPNREGPLLVVSKQDTLSWEVTPLLSEQVIVKDASEYAASMPVNHLLPHWVQTNRYYYDGGSVEMRDAGICVREDDWDGAFKLWNAVYEKAKGVRKMRAAFNIALYHEMRDDIRKASEWAEKALQLAKPGSRDEVQINIYRASLQEAEAQLLRLNVQMKRFNDKN